MARKHPLRHTKRQALTLSTHAAKLLKRRNRRLYSGLAKRGESHRLTSRLLAESGFALSTTPDTITIAQDSDIYISITLLGKLTMTLHAPGGIVRAVSLKVNPKSLELLAYLGWKRSTGVRRDLLLEQIWGHGRTDEEATREKLGWAFDSARKALRAAVQQAAEQLNAERGEILFDPKLDILEHANQVWRLSPLCRVIDLETVESQYRIIVDAKMRGILANAVPEYVKHACDALIAAYGGDFIGMLIRDHPEDLEPWVDAWMRDPVTYYRDCYLQVLWYAAEYERQAGQRLAGERSASDIESRCKQRECWGRAAELYRLYAMHACNNRLDSKVHFDLRGRGNGERVTWSEHALIGCIMLYGKLGYPYLIDEVYNAYYNLMIDISDENWAPREDTLKAVQAAKEQTSVYRLEE